MLACPQSLTTKPKREGGVRLLINLVLDNFVWVKKKFMVDLNLHGASQKGKTFFRQDNRIDRIF
jgi:hypothetical protein